MKRSAGIVAVLLTASACGQMEVEDVGVETGEIKNGTNVAATSNPKVVALYHQELCEQGNPFCVAGQYYWFPRPCSASILRSTPTESWVLTARHCVATNGTISGPLLTANRLAINTGAAPGLAPPPVGSYVPDGVFAPAAAEAEGYDLALVHVAGALPLTSTINVSIPIWQGAVNLPAGTPLTAFGYGRFTNTNLDVRTEDGTTGAGRLRTAPNLPFVSVSWNAGLYGTYTYNDANAASQSVVNGDSGGPTFLTSSVGSLFYQLVGVHSTACWDCVPARGTDALVIRAATGFLRTYLGYMFVSSYAQPARNMNVIGAIASGASVGTTTVKDSAQTHWMYDPATSKIYTTVGATRYYLTARTPAESFSTDRRVYITSAAVGNGYQQWAITPDYINNRGQGSTGNAEILNELSPGVLTVGPYFSYPASTKFAWHFNP